MTKTTYGAVKTVQGSFQDVQLRVRDKLKEQGFGIIMEIDMQKTLKEKINEEIPPYLILGACNPKFAHKALGVEPQIGLLLPCNVVVRQAGDAVEVGVIDASAMMGTVKNEGLAPLAGEVQAKLDAALAAV